MKNLQKENDAVQKISDLLLEETLNPAKEKAQLLVQQAEVKAKDIVQQAEQKAEKMFEEARKKLEQEEALFKATTKQAFEQSLESLRQSIQRDLFSPALEQLLHQPLKDKAVIANLVNALVQAIEKEGLSFDIQVFVSDHLKPDEINPLLLDQVVQNLEGKTVHLGKGLTGVEVKLKDKKITIDMTGKTLQEIVAKYIRKDLRTTLFGEADA